MDKNTHLRDELLNEVKSDANDRLKGSAKILIDLIFDCLDSKIKNLPQAIKQLRNNPKFEKEIVALWSEHLYKDGLVPQGYSGLPDNLLISNFHQDGYLSGLYVGYILAMMGLADNNVSKDTIVAIRDYMRPNLMGHHYDSKETFISKYKDEMYSWIEES